MKGLFVAAGVAAVSLFAASGAEAACRQVYGGTSCNWLGKCWHNPPKTVCDAPARIAAPPPTVRVQPGAGLISNNRSGIVGDHGGGLISNNRGGIVSQNATGNLISNSRGGIIGNNAGDMPRTR